MLTEILPPVMVLIAAGLPVMRGRLRAAFATVVVYGVLMQVLGVYFYPRGHWDNLPVSIDDSPARLWDWKDNPIIRTARGGIAMEPFEIVGAAVTGGWPAATRKMQELGVNAY